LEFISAAVLSVKAEEAMRPERFTTQPLRPQDQLEAWQEWYRPVLDLIFKDPTSDAFSAEIRLWRLGGLAMSRTIAPSAHVLRASTNLKRDPVDHWVISYCARGAHLASTAGSSLEVPARVPYLWSLGQEFLHERTHVDRFQFFMSRDTYREIAPLLDTACGSALDTPLGHLLGDYMMALERRLPAVTEADFPRLANAVGAMVAAAVAPSAERVTVAGRQIDLGRKERVRQAVRRHLRTPTLRPSTLCRLVGMSRSNLYRLFDDSGGVARYIQSERLLEAHSVLADPATMKSISAVTEDLCFADTSSFSRAFKREFGHSPSEVRSAALAGLAPSAKAARRLFSQQAAFGELLGGL
jgi:AraC-like DNA-binding protein